MERKPAYLLVIASSCQMYSGTGTAIFDWIRYAKADFEFSILMDTLIELNYQIVKVFCEKHGIKLYPSRSLLMAGCADSGVRDAAEHLNKYRYDYIECISWANASTNLGLLSSRKADSKLVFTPHTQPVWTLPEYERYFMTPVILSEMLNAADFVFIDSPDESRFPEFQDVDQGRVYCVPLGVNTDLFRPIVFDFQEKRILCVCDFGERRKRVDVLLEAFSIAYKGDPSLRLILGGKGSDKLDIPDEIAHAVTGVGYVTQESLIGLYQEAALFVLLTDYEAFGLPIAEALCCGCPVLLNELEVLVGIFSDLPGVTFTSNKDLQKTAYLMRRLTERETDRGRIARSAALRFSFDMTYGRKQSILLDEQVTQ